MRLDPDLFPQLPQPPRARTYTIRELVFQDVARGRIRMPEFQRPLRWRVAQNAELLDSLLRGYPIGSLLFWARPAEAAKIKIGTCTVEVPAEPQARWVVDGQQRITALAASMLQLKEQGPDYNIYFAPHSQEFVWQSPLPDDAIPVNVLADARHLNRWVRQRNPPDSLQELLDTAHQRLVEYTVPAYEIETNDEAPLRAIFARLNSTGARMKAEEVFHALFGQKTNNRDAIDLNLLVTEVKIAEFGVLDRGEALKAVMAVSGLDLTNRPDRVSPEELQKLLPSEIAANAIGKAARFLKEDAGIPHLRLLPYPVVLTLLAAFFHEHPDIEALDRKRLARWVWRGAATGAHRRVESLRIRQARTDIRPGSPTETIDRLLRRLHPPSDRRWHLRPFSHASANSRIEILAMLEAKPRNLPMALSPSIPEPIVVQDLIENHQILSDIFQMNTLPPEARDSGRTAANRVLLTGHRSYAMELRSLNEEKDAIFLASHLLDNEMLELLRRSDHPQFFRRRAEVLERQVERFLEQKTGWEDVMLAPRYAYLETE